MFNAVLLTTAGVVILSATLATRALAWRAANKAATTPTRPVRAIASVSTAPMLATVNDGYGPMRDWLAPAAQVNAPMLRPDYEGLDDETDGDAWVDDLRRAGYHAARAVVPMSRAYVRATNDEFERFDRITTNMMSRVDTICAATIQRWQDEWNAYSSAPEHELECATIELERIHDWIDAELREDFRLAEALLVS